MKEVKVTISRDGSAVRVETEGFTGSGCLETTEPMLASLGNVETQDMKDEFYAVEQLVEKEGM